jgi:adenylate cyclase
VQGDDEAVNLLAKQEEVVDRALPDGSRVVKELGDGLLLWFDDARAAIETCLALQRSFDAAGEDEIPLWVRMGLHWGCPRRRGDDIIGRDVNLAARIVDLAGAGEVLCSEACAAEAGAFDHIAFEELGPVFVRGIAEPIPILRVVPAEAQAAGFG